MARLRAGSALSRAPGGLIVTYLAALALVAVVTAVLNLDTAVFFLTPILLHLARQRGVDESPTSTAASSCRTRRRSTCRDRT